MWLLHLTCKEYRLSPADELGLKHPWVRWQFNHSVGALGRWVEQKLSETNEKGKHKHTVEELLGLPLKNSEGVSSQYFK